MALTDTSLQNDAIALLDDLTSNGCQVAVMPSVQTFQQSYINSGGSLAKADGYYGATAAAALQAVIDANQSNSALANQTAPAGCVGKAPSGGGSLPPVVVPSGGSSTVPESALPWVLGGLVLVAGAFAAYTYSKKHRRNPIKRRTKQWKKNRKSREVELYYDRNGRLHQRKL
jgi:hypothetical protein